MEQDETLLYIKKQLQTFFGELSQISKENPPTAKNAANPKFRDEIVGKIFSYGDYLPDNISKNLSEDAKNLFQIYSNFYCRVREGCKQCPNVRIYWWRRSRLVLDNIKNIENLPGKISDVFLALFGGIYSFMKEIWNTLTRETAWSGVYANGWISYQIYQAGIQGKKEIDEQFSDQRDVFLKRLKEIFQALENLDIKSQKTWLTGSWQKDFEKICYDASIALGVLINH